MRPINPTPLQINHIDSCESTNQSLLTAAEEGAPVGSVLVARGQTAGRGRRGRAWLAEPGKTLTFSVLWTFPVDPQSINGLSLAVGVALYRALNVISLGPRPAGVRFGLKWPNDVLLRTDGLPDAKVGGILIESVIRKASEGSRELAVVIGIGLNCLASEALQSAVIDQPVAALSDGFVDKQTLTPDAFLPVVLDALQHTLDEFSRTGFAALRDEWQNAHFWQGAAVRISEAGTPLLDGEVRGVDADGALVIATPVGIERVVTGDVSLRKV